MAHGDTTALRVAARIVREHAETQPRAALGIEHLALNLITAAYDSLREEHDVEP